VGPTHHQHFERSRQDFLNHGHGITVLVVLGFEVQLGAQNAIISAEIPPNCIESRRIGLSIRDAERLKLAGCARVILWWDTIGFIRVADRLGVYLGAANAPTIGLSVVAPQPANSSASRDNTFVAAALRGIVTARQIAPASRRPSGIKRATKSRTQR
jgi:hypothetical protein